MAVSDSRIPVTIITGFLGSGKTTLLNSIIQNSQGVKLAIIENEFGETGIDGELVVGGNDGLFELSNGCLCCSLNEDLIEVLNKILDQPKKIDHLLIETTGIADPGPIVLTFLSDYKIQSIFKINAVIALADAINIEQQLENQIEAPRQIATADIVIISKTDKVDAYTKDTVFNLIKRVNPYAQVILSTKNGLVDENDLLNLDLFSKESAAKLNDKTINFKSLKPLVAAGNLAMQSGFTKVVQHSTINSVSFTFSESLDPLRFKIWIDLALNIKTCPVYRAKGILSFYDLNDKIVFQAVNNQFVTESGGLWEGENRESKIVFIGKNLPEELFRKGLVACTSQKPFDPREFYNEVS